MLDFGHRHRCEDCQLVWEHDPGTGVGTFNKGQSHKSYFIQVVDFCVYGLLRSEKENVRKNALGINLAFDLLGPICQKQCTSTDRRKLGIIRVP